MGMKPPDICAAFGCSPCHDVIDGRVQVGWLEPFERDHYKLQGLLLTLYELHKEGLV
jgi:hypothetical protein